MTKMLWHRVGRVGGFGMIRRALIRLIVEALDQKEARDLRRMHRQHDLKRDLIAQCKRDGLSVEQARIRWREQQGNRGRSNA